MKRSIRIKKQEKLNNPHSFSSGLGTGIGGLLVWKKVSKSVSDFN
jgi:hypothetical protein